MARCLTEMNPGGLNVSHGRFNPAHCLKTREDVGGWGAGVSFSHFEKLSYSL